MQTAIPDGVGTYVTAESPNRSWRIENTKAEPNPHDGPYLNPKNRIGAIEKRVTEASEGRVVKLNKGKGSAESNHDRTYCYFFSFFFCFTHVTLYAFHCIRFLNIIFLLKRIDKHGFICYNNMR